MLKKYYEQDKCIGVCAPRAYYVPFGKDAAVDYDRENSERFASLNGTWRITPYESVLDADGFWQGRGEKEIPVPSCVQFYGYDYIQYTNVRYPFPFDPPHVPNKNPCYHYSRTFIWDGAKDEKAYLVFEGVDSCFYVYVNGQEVGFSQISHRISEFDITKFVQAGENKLDVLVLKWCMGSYLEDQDKWRFTGIIRDVYLLRRPQKHITDYKIVTDIAGTDGIVRFENRSPIAVTLLLCGQTQTVKSGETGAFTVKDAVFWSAETPYLYDLRIEGGDEVIFNRVGICTSRVENGLYLFNGKPIKFYGVNRHDFHSMKGAAVNKEDMLGDLLLMKKMNVNAIRTSHYPSSPLFYELCAEYGFYLVSESDIECHGCITCGDDEDEIATQFGLLAEDARFDGSRLMREICNVEEHKNFACVAIWSLGNEAGYGKGMRLAAEKVHALDTRPVHYEGLWEISRTNYGKLGYYEQPLDVVSRMYPTPEWMKNVYLNDPNEKRPLMLCEYLHAMGNGPGGFTEYWDVMESSPRFMGGFIWEWADHGIRTEKGYRYGGDFGEYEHDGNFCVDGITSPDRAIKAGTLAMKKAYQPLLFKKNGTTLTVFNKNYFAAECGVLRIRQSAETEVSVCIAPRETLALSCEAGDLTVRYYRGGEEEEVAREQFLETETEKSPFAPLSVVCEQKGHRLLVSAGANEYVLDLHSGEIESVNVDGKTYGRIALRFWRAPIDNDCRVRAEWDRHFLRYAHPEVKRYKVAESSIMFDIVAGDVSYRPFLKGKLIYTFSDTGVRVGLTYEIARKIYFAMLPRIGFVTKLDLSFDGVKYLAYGNEETYSDSYEFAFKDVYENKVRDQYYHYVKPQESGSHYDAEWAEVTDGTHTVRAEGMRSFAAVPYSADTLTEVKHDDELPESDGTYFYTDIYMSGLGTNACGPLPSEKHLVPDKGKGEITFTFRKKQ